MISVILAGGKGIRLWPESRRSRPKQLCSFIDNRTMLDHTIDRLRNAGSQQILIITSTELLPGIEEVVYFRPDHDYIEILSEPVGRNTAPAVGLALSRFANADNYDEVLGIFPADHHVADTHLFQESIQKAIRAAQLGHIATLGINPDRPETGYGYIEKTNWEIGEIPDVYQVKSFREKPDQQTAESYLKEGSYLWNAGIYVSTIGTFLEEFAQHLPDIHRYVAAGYDDYIRSYPLLPEISLDYGIAEKSQRIAIVPSDFGWCDLGSWNALADLYDKDPMMNVCSGNDIIMAESNNCIVKQRDKTMVIFGVDNLLVVETDQIIFVSDRNKSQDIRHIVDNLQQHNRQDLL